MMIRLKTTAAGPSGVHHIGDLWEVDARIGQQMVAAGSAEIVRVEPTERATIEPAETAVTVEKRGRGRPRKQQ